MADAINIEEANRLRLSLGMAPLPVPGQQSSNGLNFRSDGGSKRRGNKDDSEESDEDDEPASTLETREAAADRNWQKLQAEADERKRRAASKLKIQKAREAAARFAKLEGKGLGEPDNEEEVSTRDWLLSSKKRERKIAKQRQKQMQQDREERERIAAQQYTTKDLAGLKVGHELGEFDDGEEQILTLKDAEVEDESGEDELENTTIRDSEKTKERLQAKKRKLDYDPNQYEDDPTRGILSKYDDETAAKKNNAFTLDGKGSIAQRWVAAGEAAKAPPRQKISLADINVEDSKPSSDYMDISEIKVKKPKKKKDKSKSKKRPADEDDLFPLPETTTQTNRQNSRNDKQHDTSNVKQQNVSFVDDEDLQSQLAVTRRKALKKRRTDVDDLAKRILEEGAATPMDTAEDDEGGMIIDETSEFIANLKKPEEREEEDPSRPRRKTSPNLAVKDEDHDQEEDIDDRDAEMAEAYNEIDEPIKREDSKSDLPTGDDDATNTGLDDEGTLDRGTAAAVKLLRERGLLRDTNGSEANQSYRERQRFLAEKERREAAAERRARDQRSADRRSTAFANMSARDREFYAQQANKQRDQAESRALSEKFNAEYRPSVELKYVDDHGRHMNQKEAFKHLSHIFHGKTSGAGKTAKHLKKIEDERRREAQSSLDSSQATGMNNAQGERARKNRQAGVRLQ